MKRRVSNSAGEFSKKANTVILVSSQRFGNSEQIKSFSLPSDKPQREDEGVKRMAIEYWGSLQFK